MTVAPPQPTLSSLHVPALDGLRGIAILLVLAMHFQLNQAMPPIPGLRRAAYFGWSGVDLFFVLSGFLITGILLDTRKSPNYFRAFYMRRVLRVFPLYYLALLGTLALSILIVPFNRFLVPYCPTKIGWLSYFTYLQNWWMPAIEPRHMLVSNYWSLGVEEQFYLIWPFCVYKSTPRRLLGICLACSTIAVIVRFWLAPNFWVTLENTFARMDTLLIGAAVSILVRDAQLIKWIAPALPFIAAASIGGILVIDIAAREYYSRGYYTQVFGFTAVGLLYGSILAQTVLNRERSSTWNRLLSSRFLRAIGKYSYGIYIYHGVAMAFMSLYFSGFAWYGRSIPKSLALCVGTTGVIFAIAYLSYEQFEVRFLRLKRHFTTYSRPL